MNDLLIYIFTPIIIAVLIVAVLLLIQRKEQQKNIILLSQFDNKTIIDQQKNKKNNSNFTMKLIQAGITYKEYTEARLLFALIGIVIMSVLPFFFSLTPVTTPGANGLNFACMVLK